MCLVTHTRVKLCHFSISMGKFRQFNTSYVVTTNDLNDCIDRRQLPRRLLGDFKAKTLNLKDALTGKHPFVCLFDDCSLPFPCIPLSLNICTYNYTYCATSYFILWDYQEQFKLFKKRHTYNFVWLINLPQRNTMNSWASFSLYYYYYSYTTLLPNYVLVIVIITWVLYMCLCVFVCLCNFTKVFAYFRKFPSYNIYK